MLKILLLTLIISTPTFAGTLILTKFVSSGYVQPEYSFVKDCKVFKEGHAQITQRVGQNPQTSKDIKVQIDKTFLIQALNLIAQKGKLKEEGTRCDAGIMLLDGYVGGEKVILDEDKDCESHYRNLSRATRYLKKLADSICGF